MIPALSGNMLGLVELTDADVLLDRHGPKLFEAFREHFVNRLKDWIRADDQWRLLDDDRFCVVLKGLEERAQLELAVAKLARLFEEPYSYLGERVRLDVTAGFAGLGSGPMDDKEAIRKASLAVSLARKRSQLYEVYSPACEIDSITERNLVTELEAAVECGEFQLYYQPKMHAGYRNLVGAEALIRWHTRDSKVRMPDEFIEVAERNSVIRPMTWWTVKSAVSRLARWPEQLSIAVNISAGLLADDEIIAVVADALDIHGVAAARLTLEVTESIMVDDQQIMLRQLARLRKIGVRVAIDDFGTGFSSLAYFRDLPADEIKIDKSFVIPMLTSGKDYAIVKAVIDLAHNFSLRVVAEGVENEEIAKRLAQLGCDVLQGYLFDKPLLVEDFERHYPV